MKTNETTAKTETKSGYAIRAHSHNSDYAFSMFPTFESVMSEVSNLKESLKGSCATLMVYANFGASNQVSVASFYVR